MISYFQLGLLGKDDDEAEKYFLQCLDVAGRMGLSLRERIFAREAITNYAGNCPDL